MLKEGLSSVRPVKGPFWANPALIATTFRPTGSLYKRVPSRGGGLLDFKLRHGSDVQALARARRRC